MAGEDYRAGTYELVFHMGAYFRASGAPVAEPPSSTRCRCASR